MAEEAKKSAEDSGDLSAYAKQLLGKSGEDARSNVAEIPDANNYRTDQLYQDLSGAGHEQAKAAFLANMQQPTGPVDLAAAPVVAPAAAVASDAPVGPPTPAPAAPGVPQALEPNPAMLPPDGTITNPAQLASAAVQNRNQSIAENNSVQKQAEGYNAANIKAATDEAADKQPILDANVRLQQESFERQQKATAEIQGEADKRMAHYESIQTELQQMAAEKPQDLFGQAGVNPIMARIAIFFGGAGYQGNHENRNLQMIEQMADRNVQQQKMRYEMLSRVGQGDQTMYGMLQTKLGNRIATEQAIRQAYLSTAEAQTNAIANKYAGPKAKAEGMKFAAELRAKAVESNQHVRESYMQNASQAIAMQQQMEQQRLAMAQHQQSEAIRLGEYQLKLHKQEREEALYNEENSIEGFVGTVKPTEHKDLAKTVGGARNIMSTLDEMDAMIASGVSMENIRQFAINNALNFAGGRTLMDTGQNLQGREERLANAFNVNRTEGFLQQLESGSFGTDVTSLRNSIQDTKGILAKYAYVHVRAAAPKIKFDTSDPLWGAYDPATYKSKWETGAKEREGTRQGHAKLQKLSDWAADESASRGRD